MFGYILDFTHGAICEGRNVLELGAGGALPSIMATLSGARKVGKPEMYIGDISSDGR